MNSYMEVSASTILTQLSQDPYAPSLGVMRQFEKFLEEIKMRKGNCGGYLELKTGDKYKGEFAYLPGKGSFMHGYGEYKWSSGDSYEGYLHYNKKQGLGKFKYSNGDVYVGPFKNNRKQGVGLYEKKCGTTFLCTYERDKLMKHEVVERLDILTNLAIMV